MLSTSKKSIKEISSTTPTIEKYSVSIDSTSQKFLSYSLRILEYGTLSSKTTDSEEEMFSHLYRLYYIVSGHPYYQVLGQKIDLEPGSLLYLQPGQIISVDNPFEECQILFANFELGSMDDAADFHTFLNSLFPEQHVHDTNNELRLIFHTLIRIGRQKRICNALEIQNLFENLFIHIIRRSGQFYHHDRTIQQKNSDAIFNGAVTFINENIHRNFRLSELAAFLNVSENYLYKLFLRHCQVSPSEYIADLRIEMAKMHLQYPERSISNIADHLGYDNISHFSSSFRRKTGMSPSAYRKQVNGTK